MATLSSSLTTKRGFHTTYSTQIILHYPADLARCTLHLLHNLPPRTFADPYELANYKQFYTFKLSGTSHSELPVTALTSNGSVLLLNVLVPKTFSHATQNITVDVPLHVRYGQSAQPNVLDDSSFEVPWPTGFWTCPLSPSRLSHAFPNMPLDLAALFDTSSSTFISIGTRGHSLSETIQAPVGHLVDLELVEVGTTVVILLAFLYLLRAAFLTASRMNGHNPHMKIE